MRRYMILTVCAAALAMVPLAAQGGGSQQAPAKPTAKPAPQQVERSGASLYREYCAVCHGQGGRGNGPAASALRNRPADLTHIAKRYNQFPRETVEAMILGDDELHPAHGSREMPIWGPIFRKSGDPKTIVGALIKYLESLQEK